MQNHMATLCQLRDEVRAIDIILGETTMTSKQESMFRHLRIQQTRRRSILALAIMLSTILTLIATSVAGQQAGSQQDKADRIWMEEVVVTAQRRDELLRDVPISLSIFSAQDMVRNNILDVTDYFMQTPNVSFVQSGTRGERDISIRGVHNIGGQVSALAFYVDEFNIVNGPAGSNTSNSSINPHLYDMERIEVLRGPQGTFFGRNATGGAINITTKKPSSDFYGEGTAEIGSFDTYSVGGVINLPLADTFFVRASVIYRESDGYVENTNPVGGGSDTEFLNFRAAARWVPNERLTIDVSVNSMDDKQGITETVGTGVLGASSAGLLAATGNFAALDDGLGFYPQNQRRVNNDIRGMHRNEYTTVVARIEWDAGPFTITSITGDFDADLTFLKDLDFTSNGWLKFDNDVTSDSFSTELRISSNGEGRFDWVIGGIYADDELHQLFGVRGGPDIFLGLPDDFPIDTGDLVFKAESFAFFGNASWHVNDQFTLMLGGRYSNDDVSQTADGINFGTPDVHGEGDVSFDDFSPRLAATYDWNDQVTFYGTISKGYKAGGVQLNVTQQLPVVEFDEENLWNYEGGIRYSSASGRLRTNLSVFYMDWQDLQVQTNVAIIDPDTNEITFINTTTNAASSSISGLEFDITAAPTDRLTLGGGVGYLDASFGDFPDAIVNGVPTDLSGFDIPQAPKWTLNAYGQYTIPFENNWQGFARVEWSYRDDSVPGINDLLEEGFPFIAESFQVWNFRVGAENERFRLEAFVQNAFEEEYFTTTTGFGFAGIQVHPAARYYGLRFLVRSN